MLKKVVVKSEKGFKMFGKCIRPNEENTFNIRQIYALIGIGRGVKVFEVLPGGELLQLNKSNYDKVNHSSASSVIKAEADHKEPEKIEEGIPTQSDESSVEESAENVRPTVDAESENAEEPDPIKEEEPEKIDDSETINNEQPDESSVETNSPVQIESPAEEPGTVETEDAIVEDVVEDEKVENDAADAAIVEEAENKHPMSRQNKKVPKKAPSNKK